MTSSDLASPPASTYPPAFHQVDPFASPASRAADTPTFPRPCAQPPTRSYRDTTPSTTTEVRYTAHDRTGNSHKSASMSSAGESSTLTGMSSIDLEKGSLAREHHKHSRRTSSRNYVDPEKAMYKQQSPSSYHSTRHSQRRQFRDDDAGSIIYSDNGSDIDDGLALQEAKALKILLFLSGPVVALSWLNFVWTLISLLITTLSQPVRLCARRITFGQQLSSLLGPALNLQLKSIYTPLPPYANEDGVFHPSALVLVHLASPILSIGVALAAWVVAVYWAMAGIVGDPAGLDKRDDGKETVLGLRRWWENLLLKGINLE